MSSIVTQQGILHYQSIGRGKPVVLLHGWISSWDIWRESMMALAADNSRRVYALDFWGFGDSANPSHSDGASFRMSSFVEMVSEFMENLGIGQAPVAGHSMGGTVALQLALEHPQRVESVVVVGSPVVGTSLNPFLKLAGYGWIAGIVWRFPILRAAIMRFLLAGDSKHVRQMIFRDVERTSQDSFFRSIADLRDTDLSARLCDLSVPALGIYGRRDNIVSPSNAELLVMGASDAQATMMNNSRHFPMSDEPEKFLTTLEVFLGSNGHR